MYDDDSQDENEEDDEEGDNNLIENIVIVDPCRCPLTDAELAEFKHRVNPLQRWEDFSTFETRYWEANAIIREIFNRDN